MSVAIIHYSSYPVIGGVETVIQAHAKLFAKHGYPVKLITGSGKQFDPKIPVVVIPEMRSLHLVDKTLHNELQNGKISRNFEKLKTSIYGKLKRELAHTRICIAHNVLTMHFNLALTSALVKLIGESAGAGKVPQKQFISWAHDATFLDPHYEREWKNTYPWNLLAMPINGVKQVTISNLRKRKIARLFKIRQEQVTTVPDGIDPADFLGLSPAGSTLFDKLNLSSYDFVLLYPTRMVRRKNIELAVQITREMNSKGRETCILITSPPDPHNKDSIAYYKLLKNMAGDLNIENKVIFLSEQKINGGKLKVDNCLLRDLYLFSDLLLFPSKAEGFGIPILEAGLCRLPAACSKIAPLTEIGGKDVLYLDLNDSAKTMAEAIIKYLGRSPELRLYKKVMRNYTWEAIFSNRIIPLIGI